MRTEILQTTIKAALETVGQAVSGRSTLPVLSHVLIRTDDKAVSFAGTNLELFIRCKVKGRTEGEGSFTVPYRLFRDLVGTLPAEVVSLTADGDEPLLLTCKRSKAHLHGLPAEEFPAWDDRAYQMKPLVTVRPSVLKRALANVVYATATDESRPVLTGVLWHFEGNTITFAAADGFRLALDKIEGIDTEFETPLSLIVPSTFIAAMIKLLPDDKGAGWVAIHVAVDDAGVPQLVALKCNAEQQDALYYDLEMATTVIEGRFVNYEQIIPKTHKTRVTVDCRELRQAVRRADIFARYEARTVHFEMRPDDDKIKLHVESIEMGDHTSEIDAQIEGEPVALAFNTRFLLDCISSMPGPQLVIEIRSASSGVGLRPVEADLPLQCVVMPMHIRK